ncbi:antibiotic biosynthesis monooxygenase [Streptomyces sp. VNUA24]|uniref:antibiotic biosynthesis monooxygenase family protein n=1 Tax=Streptomyces sp. VNUA24 TaxID=3031131 RepID=UPI0023B85F7D|nr:antibiotic biosynthesis monooxygenase [Streptomyces sp. VNUA24]WEH16873.1 antibiotic biosynthesis monooxygenase [Streptomyces sp. VNUA24]
MDDQRTAPADVPAGTAENTPDGTPDDASGDALVDPSVVAPVPAHEPPYYAVVFTSTRTRDQSGYAETAERMEELVKGVPGFLGMDQAWRPGGPAITVGYFRDAEAIERWRTDVEHRAAQERGRAEWYENYTLHIAKVERSHSFVRGDGDGRGWGKGESGGGREA